MKSIGYPSLIHDRALKSIAIEQIYSIWQSKTMTSNYSDNTKVIFYEFTRQYEEEEAIVQSALTGATLVLPIDAMEIVDALVAGETIQAVKNSYELKYGEIPDILDLLNLLEEEGFISPSGNESLTKGSVYSSKHNNLVRYHFADFPQHLAQNIFSHKVLFISTIPIGIALTVAVIDPAIIPGWKASFFTENLTVMRLILIAFDFITLFGHEMAHSIAAKAFGVSSRMAISHRLWHLVAETDITGVWGIPRQHRFLPILAGPLLDTICASILILVLFAERHTALSLSKNISQLFSAMLLIYIMRLLWQCYFFIRTDFYYVFTNLFNCKDLMNDTEVFLKNHLHYFIPKIHKISQLHIPVKERRVIRLFSIFWVGGRVLALLSLIFLEIPLLYNYCLEIGTIISRGYQEHPYAFIDAISMGFLIVVPQFIGFWLWFRSFNLSHE